MKFYAALTFLLLQTAGFSLPHSSAKDGKFAKILSDNFFKQHRLPKHQEYVHGKHGVVGHQQTITDGKNSLSLLELTNGSTIVQLVFTDGYSLSECDSSTSRRHIRKLLKHVTSKCKQEEFTSSEGLTDDFVLNDRFPLLILDTESKNITGNSKSMNGWIEECSRLHAKQLSLPEDQSTLVVSQPGQVVKVDRSAIQPYSSGKVRNKRGFMDLIYPGTNWCGRGNSSKSYDDLGKYNYTDHCCRDHDHCEHVIPGFSKAYNYFNLGFLSVSSCDCDSRLKSCLHNAAKLYDEELADMIGHIYFNVIGMDCFNLTMQKVCTRSSFWGRCFREEKRKVAVFGETMSYGYGL